MSGSLHPYGKDPRRNENTAGLIILVLIAIYILVEIANGPN